MNGAAALVLLPPSRPADAAVSPALPLLGLPLIRRNALSAARAGIASVHAVAEDSEGTQRLLGDAPARLLAPGEAPPDAQRLIVLAGQVLADSQWLKTLVGMPLLPGEVYRDGNIAAVLGAGRAPAAWRSPDDFFAALDRVETKPLPPDPRGRFELSVPGDIARAQDWLLERLIKSGDSYFTRMVSRRLSLAISRRLAATRVTPNQVTIASILIGLAATPFFLSSQAAWQTAGAALLLIHDTIDGCDGELARLKFQTSREGMILDMWGDNLVHAALFSCMGIGWWLNTGSPWTLGMAAAAVAGTLWAASLVYRQTVRETAPGAVPQFSAVLSTGTSALSRLVNAMGNRDFLYGLFALALLGKAHWLLLFAALGSPLFALGLICVSRRGSPD